MEIRLKGLIGQRIKNVRLSCRLSQEKFAERAGITPQFLSDIERGNKSISAETLYQICSAFDISSEYILFGVERNDLICSPFSNYLEKLSDPAYRTVVESLLKSYCDTIEIAKGEKKEL